MVVLIILTNLMTYNYANSQCAGATSKIHSEAKRIQEKVHAIHQELLLNEKHKNELNININGHNDNVNKIINSKNQSMNKQIGTKEESDVPTPMTMNNKIDDIIKPTGNDGIHEDR
eukprot:UN00484